MAGKRPREATIVRSGFAALVTEVKGRIQAAQTRAMLAVNTELVRLYWDIGHIIDERRQREGWGAAVIPRLAVSLHNELPDVKGFSERNVKRMLAFYREYRGLVASSSQAATQIAPASKVTQPVAQIYTEPKVPPSVAKLPALFVQEPLAQIPWYHHIALLEKLGNLTERLWYVHQVTEQGWSHNIPALQILPQLAANLYAIKKLPGGTRWAGAATGDTDWAGEEEMRRVSAIMSEQQAEAEKLDAITCLRRGVGRQVAANLPVHRSTSEGGKELGYGG